jgi:hypothetical protein
MNLEKFRDVHYRKARMQWVILKGAQKTRILIEMQTVKIVFLRIQVQMRTVLGMSSFLLHSGKDFVYILSVF